MSEAEAPELMLAAEDFPSDQFSKYHYFAAYEERVLQKLLAHGPVLLRGGRGSGKSALLREAANRLNTQPHNRNAVGIYLSLRHLPLLRSTGTEYESILCDLILQKTNKVLEQYGYSERLVAQGDVLSLQKALDDLASRLSRRLVLIFDDAAHIGREASLEDFFGTFRTISGSQVSCKAAIYPGVTKFGRRFDAYNDATVVDLTRNEGSSTFAQFFTKVMELRYGTQPAAHLSDSAEEIAPFIARSVVGNVRAFIFVCNTLWERAIDSDQKVGLPQLSDTFLFTAQGYFWPLLEELEPKLGAYEPLIPPARDLASLLYQIASRTEGASAVLVHRDYVQKLDRLFEVLEYAGFIARREASRAMKSGGRGTRFVLNLCNLLEYIRGSRLTRDQFAKWVSGDPTTVEIHSQSELTNMKMPLASDDGDLAILAKPIDTLVKSKAYPYGLTDKKVRVLMDAGIQTIGALAASRDEDLDALPSIGPQWVARIRGVVAQAIWM